MALDFTTKPTYDVTHSFKENDLTVEIEPLAKREEIKLTKKFTKDKIEYVKARGRGKKKEDRIIMPDTDHYGLNLATALLTWKSWSGEAVQIRDQKTKEITGVRPCNEENIKALFSFYYDELAAPIMEKLSDLRDGDREDEEYIEAETTKN